MLFFSILNPKIHSIKPGKYYKICNITALSILLIYLFSLSNSLSPTSFSFSGSLFVSHISLISPLSLSLSLSPSQQDCMFEIGFVARRTTWWHEIGVEEIDVEIGVLCVFLWLLWRFIFVVLVVVVSCCDWSCGCNVWWVSVVLDDGFGWGWDRGDGFWLGLRLRWWVWLGLRTRWVGGGNP